MLKWKGLTCYLSSVYLVTECIFPNSLYPDNSLAYNFNPSASINANARVCVRVEHRLNDLPGTGYAYLSVSDFYLTLETLRKRFNFANRISNTSRSAKSVHESIRQQCATSSQTRYAFSQLWVWSNSEDGQTIDRSLSFFNRGGDKVCTGRIVLSTFSLNSSYQIDLLEISDASSNNHAHALYLDNCGRTSRLSEYTNAGNGRLSFRVDDICCKLPTNGILRIILETSSIDIFPDAHDQFLSKSAFCLFRKPTAGPKLLKEDLLVRLQLLELSPESGQFFPATVGGGDAFSLVCGMQRRIGISFTPISDACLKTLRVVGSGISGRIIVKKRDGSERVCRKGNSYPLDFSPVSSRQGQADFSPWVVLTWDSSRSACKYLNTASAPDTIIVVTLNVDLEYTFLAGKEEKVIVMPFDIEIPLQLSASPSGHGLSSLYSILGFGMEDTRVTGSCTMERIYCARFVWSGMLANQIVAIQTSAPPTTPTRTCAEKNAYMGVNFRVSMFCIPISTF